MTTGVQVPSHAALGMAAGLLGAVGPPVFGELMRRFRREFSRNVPAIAANADALHLPPSPQGGLCGVACHGWGRTRSLGPSSNDIADGPARIVPDAAVLACHRPRSSTFVLSLYKREDHHTTLLRACVVAFSCDSRRATP